MCPLYNMYMNIYTKAYMYMSLHTRSQGLYMLIACMYLMLALK